MLQLQLHLLLKPLHLLLKLLPQQLKLLLSLKPALSSNIRPSESKVAPKATNDDQYYSHARCTVHGCFF